MRRSGSASSDDNHFLPSQRRWGGLRQPSAGLLSKCETLARSAIIFPIMCGRYRLSRRKQIVEEHFASLSGEEDWGPRYNMAPTQPIPIIRQNPVIRWGLLIFVAFAVWENMARLLSISSPKLEPFAFAAFLGTLGYVAARRTLQRDQQLNEIQKELEVARRIQLSILPAEFPDSTHFRVAARYVPMTSVAGDFYDYIVADDHQAGLLIADVSGHGGPAALIASMVKLAAASQRAFADEPSRFLSGMNSAPFGNTQNQFVTAAYVYLNAESRELRYSAAGHPPMLLLRNGGIIEILENGLMLAAFDFASYSTAIHKLEPSDRILLYMDGIVEASNAAGDFYGKDTLFESLRKTTGLSPSAAADSIISSVRQWSARQDDDLTVLVCDYVST